jgi:hypothetical protein
MVVPRRLRSTLASFTLAALCAFAAPASASLVFTYNASGCCGVGPFGTVTLTDLGGGTVDVVVALNPGIGFVNSGAGDVLNFNLSGFPALAAGDFNFISPGLSFHQGPPLIHADGSGNWMYGILCDVATCGTGGNNPYAGPIHFTLSLGGLTESSFIATADSNGNYFASDICGNFPVPGRGCAGNTGMVWTSTPPVERNVPEPGTIALLGIAALGLAGVRRAREG